MLCVVTEASGCQNMTRINNMKNRLHAVDCYMGTSECTLCVHVV